MGGLCIGTVQFGTDYGVQGGKRPSVDDACRCLEYAVKNGVDAIDTAAAYGTAEDVVGEFLSRGIVRRDRIQVISKFGHGFFENARPEEYEAKLLQECETSLKRLKTDYLDAYICHIPTVAGDPAAAAAMLALKRKGLARHVGISIYEAPGAEAVFASEGLDFIQAPFSILDQRMKTSGALGRAAAKGVDLHTRSAFVQGLMLMAVDAIPEHLAATRPYVAKLEELCRAAGLTRREIALAFVKAQPEISHLVFGVDNLRQLEEIVTDYAKTVPADVLNAIAAEFVDLDQNLFMPNKWAKK